MPASPLSVPGTPWKNIFDYEGAPGHEIFFAADIELLDRSLYERDEILYTIESGKTVRAIWVDPARLAAGGVRLYPSGLASQLGPTWELLA